MLDRVAVLPPGPRTSAAWQLLRYSHSPLPFLEECARRYGDPYSIRLAGYGKFVVLADPAAVKDVFRGDEYELHSGEGNEFLSVTLGKSSVLVLDGQPHVRQRRILLPPLKGDRMRSFFTCMQEATRDELDSWPRDKPLRTLEPMQNITLRVILQAVLGLAPGAELNEFQRLVIDLLKLGRSRYSLILMKLAPMAMFKNIRWWPYFRQLYALDKALFAFIAERRRLGRVRESHQLQAKSVGLEDSSHPTECVLADLLAASHEDGQPLSDHEIRDAIVTMLVAGHDTTAMALAWALEQIVPRGDVVERITEELQRVCGGQPPTADQLPQLEYVDAVIRESLRIRTVFPFVVRLTKRPFVAGGREYPPGIVLCPCNHLVHRREDLYPQPEEFRPQRFLERKYAVHEWFPFGGGNRMCLGMAFALYEMKVVLSTLFAQLRLERPAGSRSRPIRQGIAIAPDDGALMRVVGQR